jgi:hypothetical protein
MKIETLRLATAIAVFTATFTAPFAVFPAEAQAAFVARKVIGKVHHMAESQQTGRAGYDVATVLLDVPADKLFAFALERAHQNKSLRVVMQDPGARRFQIAEGHRTLTFNIIAISDEVSHMVLAGTAGKDEGSTTSLAVGAILRVCQAMKKECSLG